MPTPLSQTEPFQFPASESNSIAEQPKMATTQTTNLLASFASACASAGNTGNCGGYLGSSSGEAYVPNNSLVMGAGHPLLGPDGLPLNISAADASHLACLSVNGNGGARRQSSDSLGARAPTAGDCCEGPVPNNSVVSAMMSVIEAAGGNPHQLGLVGQQLSRHGTFDSFSSIEQLVPNNSFAPSSTTQHGGSNVRLVTDSSGGVALKRDDGNNGPSHIEHTDSATATGGCAFDSKE